MRSTSILLLLLLPALLFGGGTKEIPDEKPVVAVSILPQAFFIDSIAGDFVRVVTLVGEGQNPHSYEPSPSQMALLAQACVWLLSGTDFEVALRPKVAKLYPSLSIIDATEGMVLRTLEEEDDGQHHHSAEALNIDRHTWLGHDQAKVLLTTVHRPSSRWSMKRRPPPSGCAPLSLIIRSTPPSLSWKRNFAHSPAARSSSTTLLRLLPRLLWYHARGGGDGWQGADCQGPERLITLAKAHRAPAIFVQSSFPLPVPSASPTQSGHRWSPSTRWLRLACQYPGHGASPQGGVMRDRPIALKFSSLVLLPPSRCAQRCHLPLPQR